MEAWYLSAEINFDDWQRVWGNQQSFLGGDAPVHRHRDTDRQTDRQTDTQVTHVLTGCIMPLNDSQRPHHTGGDLYSKVKWPTTQNDRKKDKMRKM